MNLSQISIKNRVFAWMLMSFLVLFGTVSVLRLGISEMPDVDFPMVSITINYEGAAPEIMETDVADIIEDSVMSVQGIKSISSVSKQSVATITVEFELDRDIDVAVQEIQTKIAQAQKQLPKDIDPVIVNKANPEDNPIIWIGLYGQVEPRDLMKYARDHLKNQFQTIPGVGEVMFGGYLDPVIRVWLDLDKMKQFEISAGDVVDALKKQQIEIPAGRIETDQKEINIRALGEAKTVEDLGNILIPTRGGASVFKPIALKDIAKIEKGMDDVRRISRTNQQPALGLGIKKQRGANAVAIARKIKQKLEELKTELPAGYHVQINFDSTQFIEDSTNEMKHHLALAAICTAVVCLFFLGSWGATFNVLLAIPTSIIGACIFIYMFGFTLNTFTLLGLVLSIGIVVDDAIMVLENITRYQEEGLGKMKAASEGTSQITGAAIATTLALIAVFIPVVFMKGIIGKFFLQFGIVISVTVLLSLLEALTLTPMRCSIMNLKLKAHWFEKKISPFFDNLTEKYRRGLSWCLDHKKKVIIAAAIFWIGTMALFPFVQKEFLPAQDQSMFLIRVQTPLGSSIYFTSEKMKLAEAMLSKHPSVTKYYAAVGGFGGGEVNAGMLFVTLKPKGERPVDEKLGRRPTQTDVINSLREQLKTIPDFIPILMDLSTRGFSAERGFPVEFSVRGPDWEKLADTANQIVAEMKKDPNFVDVDTDYQLGQPEAQIIPNRDVAFQKGVSMDAIGQAVNILFGGVKAAKFVEDGHRNDIRVKLGSNFNQSTDDIKKVFLRNSQGELVALSDLVEVKQINSLKSITRKDRERAIGIFANPGPGRSQDQALKQVKVITDKLLPQGYRMVFSGSAQTFKESFQSLLIALILGLAVAYMILGSQYNSFVHPVTVLMALPFSLSGAVLALFVFGKSLNIFSFIGVILLMGLAKKNSILLVDFSTQLRETGKNVREALMEASPLRLRPILMTSFATIAAALPSSLGLGAGAESRTPMALILIGGILVSTVLTLFVVPCVYSVLARFEKAKSTEV